MSLELYNTTNKTKIVPKYRYNGKYKLEPYQSVDIEDFAAKFFEPWQKIGVVVRVKKDSITEIKQEEIIEPVIEPIKVDVVEEPIIEHDSVEAVEDTKISYTSEELQLKSLKELKEIAEGLGIELEDARKKTSVIDAIISKVSE